MWYHLKSKNSFFRKGGVKDMLVATWNVNSITVRLEAVLKWLQTNQPDVLCLQETKTVDEKFPAALFKEAGYFCEFAGQPTYNGVAILSKKPLLHIEKDLGQPEEKSKRFIKAEVNDCIIINTYIPNGQALGSEKFNYKLQFIQWFKNYLNNKCHPSLPIVWCGDFNIAPAGIDTYDELVTAGQVMCSEEERIILSNLNDWGFIDTFRLHNKESGHYSWWDYRMGAFRRNLGYRIDHIWATRVLAGNTTKSSIDREPRKWERPSDHAPVITHFNI